jgi:hypothetical protein
VLLYGFVDGSEPYVHSVSKHFKKITQPDQKFLSFQIKNFDLKRTQEKKYFKNCFLSQAHFGMLCIGVPSIFSFSEPKPHKKFDIPIDKDRTVSLNLELN